MEENVGIGKREPAHENEDHSNGEMEKPKAPKEQGQIKKLNHNNQTTEMKEFVKVFKVVNGIAPVDEYVPNRERYRVCNLFNKTFSKVLNQSSAEENKNKFYILQMLECPGTSEYFVYFRWGRIGAKGMDSLIPFGRNLGASIAEFEAKYNDKATEGNYEELEIVFDDELSAEEQEKQLLESLKKTKLSKPVSGLIQQIFSIKLMNDSIKEVGYDVKKLPLGKLSQNNLKMGMNLLRQIMKELEDKEGSKEKIEQNSNKFFTFVPHDIGFKKMSEFAIRTKEDVQKKIELLDTLTNMKVTHEMIGKDEGSVDKYYDGLKNEIHELNHDGEDYKQLEKYWTSTMEDTHGKYELLEIFSLKREGEDVKFKKDLENRKLLWHGSRLANYAGILRSGLKVPPPEAPIGPFILGKGIYFADMASKASRHCHIPPLGESDFLLLLCDVALGTQNKLVTIDYNANKLPQDTNSTLGCGRFGPAPSREVVHKDGFTIPMGPGSKTPVEIASLAYNEYVVYSPDQVKLKYLLKCRAR